MLGCLDLNKLTRNITVSLDFLQIDDSRLAGWSHFLDCASGVSSQEQSSSPSGWKNFRWCRRACVLRDWNGADHSDHVDNEEDWVNRCLFLYSNTHQLEAKERSSWIMKNGHPRSSTKTVSLMWALQCSSTNQSLVQVLQSFHQLRGELTWRHAAWTNINDSLHIWFGSFSQWFCWEKKK